MKYKYEWQRQAQRILNHTIGPVVSRVDEEFLTALLAKHPNAEAKIGTGVDHFEVRSNRFNTPTFWLVRRDESETDFSYRKCLHGEPSHRAQVLAAFRLAISEQVISFKNFVLAQPNQRCSVTGAPLDKTCHVDHSPPFVVLAETFAQECGGFHAIGVCQTKDGVIGRFLVDDALAERWRVFHRNKAVLSCITAEANQRKGSNQE